MSLPKSEMDNREFFKNRTRESKQAYRSFARRVMAAILGSLSNQDDDDDDDDNKNVTNLHFSQ